MTNRRFSASPPTTTIAPRRCWSTAGSPPRRRKSASRASGTTRRSRSTPAATCSRKRASASTICRRVAFYDKPFLKFERLLETYHAFAPRGPRAASSPRCRCGSRKSCSCGGCSPTSCASSGERAAPRLLPRASPVARRERVLSVAVRRGGDPHHRRRRRVGDDDDRARARAKDIEILSELHFPHSVGLLYSAFTYYLGFTVNSGEYKLMGLAPYGNAGSQQDARTSSRDDHARAGRHPPGRLDPAEHAVLRLRHRPADGGRGEVGAAVRHAAARAGVGADAGPHGPGAGHPAGHRGDRAAACPHGARR